MMNQDCVISRAARWLENLFLIKKPDKYKQETTQQRCMYYKQPVCPCGWHENIYKSTHTVCPDVLDK